MNADHRPGAPEGVSGSPIVISSNALRIPFDELRQRDGKGATHA